MIYTGIDCGKSGAIVSVDASGRVLELNPFAQAETAGRIALIVADHVAALCSVHGATPDTIAAAIEVVHAMPKQGVVSTFTFGRAYGEALGGAIVSGVRVAHVTPQQWQRDLSIPRRSEATGHKRVLREIAEATFGRRFTLATADAALLAEWSRRFGAWSVRSTPPAAQGDHK